MWVQGRRRAQPLMGKGPGRREPGPPTSFGAKGAVSFPKQDALGVIESSREGFQNAPPFTQRRYRKTGGGKIIADEIEAGSVVKLKSGGARMTVEAVFRDAGGRMCVRCTWFSDTKRTSQAFELEAVEIA
jgi:uncharacterized protein YodC (DUF2158 family)